ncbi:hypothetical protein AS188_02400 [Kocuria flava]|uniref:DUF5666 domain-containing protein n=1 Tax=Kocuria flava TaxID=446860 RepID=A0A0U3H7D9_9MICC|nr:hypothetical protein [Kocuria flava]ALU38789.1 hypothetical protein AS188_02400 [Kocuria flava]GEO91969.1 hypothetical protein KFL01_12750 [Kocuria flava]
MRRLPRTTAAAAALLLAGTVAGCAEETELTQADQSGVPTEELVGETMTLTGEVQAVLAHQVIAIGAEDTLVMAEQLPEGIMVGDEVEATGTVEERDVFTVDDLESLQTVTDQETAQLYVDRGEEPILVDATVTAAG